MYSQPSEIPPPLRLVNRRSSDVLPPYRFVPGLQAHPLRAEHLHLAISQNASLQEQWNFGVDLFNYNYFWEAHEVWEGLWKTCKTSDPQNAAFVQGCILWSASILVNHLGRIAISGKMLKRAIFLMEKEYCDREDLIFDVDIPAILRQTQHLFLEVSIISEKVDLVDSPWRNDWLASTIEPLQ